MPEKEKTEKEYEDRQLNKWLEGLKMLILGAGRVPASHMIIQVNKFKEPACTVVMRDKFKQELDYIVEKEME